MVGCLLGSKQGTKQTIKYVGSMCTTVVVLLNDGTEGYAPPHAVWRIVQQLLECSILSAFKVL
eukprot:2942341-Prorocentrum_lima.AAC.1